MWRFNFHPGWQCLTRFLLRGEEVLEFFSLKCDYVFGTFCSKRKTGGYTFPKRLVVFFLISLNVCSKCPSKETITFSLLPSCRALQAAHLYFICGLSMGFRKPRQGAFFEALNKPLLQRSHNWKLC